MKYRFLRLGTNELKRRTQPYYRLYLLWLLELCRELGVDMCIGWNENTNDIVATASGGGGMVSGMMGTVVQGMALGAGSEVGHMAVRSMFGGSGGGHQEAAAPQPTQATSAPAPVYNSSSFGNGGSCQLPQQDLYKCLQEQNGNAGACQFYFDALKQCQEGGL